MPSLNGSPDDALAGGAPVQSAPIQNRDGRAASLSAAGARTSRSADAVESEPVRNAKPLVIGIAGGSGSGKSTVARRVGEALSQSSVAFLDMDAY
jgi:pantothenate kinase